MDHTFAFSQQQSSRVLLQVGAERHLPEVVARLRPHGVVVVHDSALAETAQRVGAALDASAVLAVDEGEAAKRLEVVGALADRMHDAGATRATVMVAIGGGTITDLAGFVASIYLRGVPFVSCPTTTLAMCDASLGGKNGVDHSGLKNRLGTIRQPDAIVMDLDWLRSLPDEMFREGIVEVIKKAAVLDADRFAELEQLAPALLRREDEATERTIAMAVDMKMAVVLADEREGDRRRALNAGHTIGHAIESLAQGSLRHGHAVAMGMIAECLAADVDARITARIEALLRAVGVSPEVPAEYRVPDQLWELARHDKKAVRGDVPMYVPRRLGDGEIVDLTADSLHKALQ
ncbi:MAG: 3-dehydroquinate synthase family protein [Planctomycetota bacterium]